MNALLKFWPLPFFILSVLFALIYEIPLYVALILSFAVIAYHCRMSGIPFKPLILSLNRGLKSIFSVMVLLSLIMMVIPLWIKIGTIPTLLTFGFETLKQQNLVIIAFILPTVLSMTIGTAMGTMSILMSSLLVLGAGAGIPPAIIVGAVVSGAYIGDRSALMSGSVHLNASVTDTSAQSNFFYMMRTLIPGVVIGGLAYFIIGLNYPMTPETSVHFQTSADALRATGSISLSSLAPILLLIGLLLLARLKMSLAMIFTVFLSFMLFLTQGNNFLLGIQYMFSGYALVLDNGLQLSSSGFMGILPVLLVILFSTLINQLFDLLNLIKPLLDRYLGTTQSFVPISLKVGLLSFLISVITCSQTLMIVICGQHLKSYYTSLGYDRKDLMLTIADYGIITVALIPWNINGQLIEALTGVKTLSYAPFALICLLMPLMNFLHSLIHRDPSKCRKS